LLCFFWETVVSQTICLDWPQTSILLILASQVARITGIRHQHPVSSSLLGVFLVFDTGV
jgi:hypothetical protein